MARRFAFVLPVCLIAAAAHAQVRLPEEQPQVTRIVSPAPGTVVPKGSILFVEAEIHVPGPETLVPRVALVTLEVDRKPVGTLRREPWVFRWDTTRADVGEHLLRVGARDLDDKETVSDFVQVEVAPRVWSLPDAPPGDPVDEATWSHLIAMAQDVNADLHLRHSRLGLVDALPDQPVVGDDPLSGTADPRASLLTGSYVGACAYWYAAVRDPEAMSGGTEANEALHMLSSATGASGLLSRWFRNTTQRQPDEGQVGLLRWRQNGIWRWLGDATPQDYAGVFFGHALYFDHVAQQYEKPPLVQDVLGLANRILKDGLVVTTADGLTVPGGDLSPERLSKPYNAILALGFLKTAYHVTGEQKFDDEYWRLIRTHGYPEKGIKPKDAPTEQWGPYDDYAVMLMYNLLLDYETDAEVLEAYRKGVGAIFDSMSSRAVESRSARRPLFNMIYKRAFPDTEPVTQQEAVEWLRDSRSPLGDSEWLLTYWLARYHQIIR